MAEYREGELIRVEIEGRVVLDDDGRLEISYGSPSVQWGTIVRPDQPGVTVTRVAPPEWPPRPGDLWRDKYGELWFIHAHAGLNILGGKAAGGARWTDDVADLLNSSAPLTLVRREPDGGES